MQNNAQVLQLIEEKKFAAAKELLVTMNEINIAALLSDVDAEEMLVMFRLLPKNLAAEVFAFLSVYSQELIVSAFSDARKCCK